MAKTISTTIKGNVSYSLAADNPLTITSYGAILASTGNALSLASGIEWTVVNEGSISAANGIGVTASVATILNSGVINANGTGRYGVWLRGNATLADSVVVNSGTITDALYSASQPNAYGAVYIQGAGEVTNAAGGLLSGAANGVMGFYKGTFELSVVNAGTIIGPTIDGVSSGGKLSLVNSGTIIGGDSGVVAQNPNGTSPGGNVVTNIAGGVIAGSKYGISMTGSSTLTNAGTVSGSADSILFTPGGTDRLIVDPGAVFSGKVNGGNAIGSGTLSTLELASSAGTGTGTLTGLGASTGLYNFGAVTVDPGAHWSLNGASTLAAGATLTDSGSLTIASSLAGTGTIALANNGLLAIGSGVSLTPTLTGLKNGTLLLPGNETATGLVGGKLTLSGSESITLSIAGSYTLSDFKFSYISGVGTVLVACYAAGTEIETAQGPVAVEHLRAGMRLRTASGALRRLRWLGQRHHAAAEVAARDELRPVRIAAGSLGDGLPRRDLRLSPEHALLLDGVLVPAIQLLGVPGITQEAAGAVTYFHVELDTHDAILAEGAAAETYIDAHSGAVFDNADTRPTPPVTIPCAPRIVSGPVLGDIRRRLGAPETQRAAGPRQTTAAVLGHVETCIPGHIAGWALQPDAPEAPVHLLIAADGIPCGTALANGFRFDLRRAGLGQGNAAFSFTGPIPAQARSISVTRQDDGTHLPGSPFTLAA